MRLKATVANIKKLRKIALYLLLALLLLLVSLRVLLELSSVQTFITSKVANYVESEFDVKVRLDEIKVSFFDNVHLMGLYVEDHHQDTLAYIGETQVAISDFLFETGASLDFSTVALQHGKFYLRKYEADSVNNLSVLINKFGSSEDTTSSSGDVEITCSDLKITDFRFIYDDEDEVTDLSQIDWSHLDLKHINIEMEDVLVFNDSVNANIKLLQCTDHSGFDLKHFSGNAVFSSTETSVQDLHIVTNASDLYLQLEFKYDSIMDYAEFLDRVHMKSTFDSVELQMNDLSYFAEDLRGWDQVIHAKGNVKGTVSNLSLKKFDLEFGQTSRLYGNIDLNGLPNIDETFINLNLKTLETNASDLATIPTFPLEEGKNLSIPDEIERMGDIAFHGSFTGFINDFVAYGTFKTGLGTIKTDLKLDADDEKLAYSGKLGTANFDLGKLLDDQQTFGKTSLNLKLNGQGATFEEISATMQGKVQLFTLNNYAYRNISINGQLKQKVINGQLTLNDPNAKLDFDGTIDLAGELPKFKFEAQADSVMLFPLHLSDRDTNAVLSTGVYVNFEGNSLNNILGRANLNNLEYYEKGSLYTLDKIELTAFGTSEGKTIMLETDNVDAYISGEFNTSKLPSTLTYMASYVLPSLFEERPKEPDELEKFELSLEVRKESELVELFTGVVDLYEDVDVKIKFNSEEKFVNLDLTSKGLDLSGVKFINPNLNIHAEHDSVNVTLNNSKVEFSEDGFIEQVELRTLLAGDHINLELDWDNLNSERAFSGDINLNATIFSPTEYHVELQESYFNLADTLWEFSGDNSVHVTGDSIDIHEIKLTNGTNELLIDGTIAKDSSAVLNIDLKQFDLAFLSVFTENAGLSIKGELTGETSVSSLYENIVVQSDNNFKGLFVNGQEIGSGTIQTDYNNRLNALTVHGGLSTSDAKTLKFSGNYYPQRAEDNFDLRIDFEAFKLQMLNPFLEEYVVFNKGDVSGLFKIKGSMDQPEISGEFTTNDINVHVVYLNTDYSINGEQFNIAPDWFGTDAATIVDSKGHTATLNMTVIHENYSNMNFDIFLFDLNQFTLLNTRKGNEEMYYGSAYVSGYASVAGYQDNLQIEANLSTDKNTHLYIPLDGPEEVGETPFIVFVDTNTNTIQVTEQTDLSGIQMNFDLEVTEDAQVEIIFDETVGDVITAQGVGDLTLEINTNGTFNMFGTYEVNKGSYLFTLENIISKRFQVISGGIINWNGDPMAGRIDMKTEYKLRTSLYNLNIGAGLDSNQLRQRIPVSLYLDLTGNYLQPDFDFSFGLPTTYSDVESILNNLDVGEKNKQAFTLLLLNSFLPIDGTTTAGATSNAFGKSSSELLSNQLSNWLSQISDDFDIGVNYRPGDDISSDEVEVALSTQLFNDRISVEGNFGVQGDNGSTASQNNETGDNLIGDFQVEYKISKDGKLRGKAFNETNTFDVANENQSRYTQGVGIIYREEFNTFGGLWCRVREQFKKKANRDLEACKEQERQRMIERQRKKMARLEERLKIKSAKRKAAQQAN